MNKKYVSPRAEVKNFASEDVILTSGVNNNDKLTAMALKSFSNADANVSWKSKVSE